MSRRIFLVVVPILLATSCLRFADVERTNPCDPEYEGPEVCPEDTVDSGAPTDTPTPEDTSIPEDMPAPEDTPAPEDVPQGPSYTGGIKEIIDSSCVSCHAAHGAGTSYPLTTYEEVKVYVDSGKLQEKMEGEHMGVTPSTRDAIIEWLQAGAPEWGPDTGPDPCAAQVPRQPSIDTFYRTGF